MVGVIKFKLICFLIFGFVFYLIFYNNLSYGIIFSEGKKHLFGSPILLPSSVVYVGSFSLAIGTNKSLSLSNNDNYPYGSEQRPLVVKEEYSPILVILGVAGVIAAIGLYFLEQKLEKRNNLLRSTETILKELQDNKYYLSSNHHEHIKYVIRDTVESKDNKNIQNVIDYTNGYLEIDAYESVLSSGLLTHFSVSTQHHLTLLYSRIRSRNNLITYRDKFEDHFFLNDDSESRREKWYKKVQKYDIVLTEWEKEIKDLMDKSEVLIEKEKPRNYKLY